MASATGQQPVAQLATTRLPLVAKWQGTDLAASRGVASLEQMQFVLGSYHPYQKASLCTRTLDWNKVVPQQVLLPKKHKKKCTHAHGKCERKSLLRAVAKGVKGQLRPKFAALVGTVVGPVSLTKFVAVGRKLFWEVSLLLVNLIFQTKTRSSIQGRSGRNKRSSKIHGASTCDKSLGDRIFNVVSSLPFIGIGAYTVCRRKTVEGKLWGASIVGVGCASTAFHSTSHDCNHICRKLDYWSIALSSVLLTRVIRPTTPVGFSLSSAGLVPFRPVDVTSANTAFVEADFLLRACENRDLRGAHALHTCAGAAGVTCFTAEVARPKLKYVHGVWHLLSATSLATTNALLAYYEEKRGLGDTQPVWPLSLWGFGAQKTDSKIDHTCGNSIDDAAGEATWRIQSV